MGSMDNTLVSVIVPTYNEEKYLEETLLNVRSQTYKNIEIIVSDGCSTDRTTGVAKKHAD